MNAIGLAQHLFDEVAVAGLGGDEELTCFLVEAGLSFAGFGGVTLLPPEVAIHLHHDIGPPVGIDIHLCQCAGGHDGEVRYRLSLEGVQH